MSRKKNGFFNSITPKQNSPFVVYAIRCPDSNEIVYIGATCDLKKRIMSHFCRGKRKSTYKWIQKLKSDGKIPIFEIVEECVTDGSAAFREMSLIEAIRPRLNSDKARLYGGTSNRSKERVVFPNGAESEQTLLSKQSSKIVPVDGESVAVRRIKEHMSNSGIRLTTVASLTGVTYQCIGQILDGKSEPNVRLAMVLCELFRIEAKDWVRRCVPHGEASLCPDVLQRSFATASFWDHVRQASQNPRTVRERTQAVPLGFLQILDLFRPTPLRRPQEAGRPQGDLHAQAGRADRWVAGVLGECPLLLRPRCRRRRPHP